MVGVPIEFENICEMMKYFKSNENINVKTQVIGLAVGKKDELFPKNREYLFFFISSSSYCFNFSKLTKMPLD